MKSNFLFSACFRDDVSGSIVSHLSFLSLLSFPRLCLTVSPLTFLCFPPYATTKAAQWCVWLVESPLKGGDALSLYGVMLADRRECVKRAQPEEAIAHCSPAPELSTSPNAKTAHITTVSVKVPQKHRLLICAIVAFGIVLWGEAWIRAPWAVMRAI